MDETAALQGHRIRFATVGLAAESGVMRGQLLGIGDRKLREVVANDSGPV